MAHDFFVLSPDGDLFIKKGYAWDGPSGPTFDTPSAMRASLAHDALYQMLRNGALPSEYREQADNELHRLAIADGMWPWRADMWLFVLHRCGASAASPESIKMVYIAP